MATRSTPQKLAPAPPSDIALVSNDVRKMFPQALKDVQSPDNATRAFGAQIIKQLGERGTDIDRKFMGIHGAIPALVAILEDSTVAQFDKELTLKAIVAVCKRCQSNVEILKENDNMLRILIQVLREGTDEGKSEAAKLVQGLGSGDAEITLYMGQMPGMLSSLAELMRIHSKAQKDVAEKATRTIWFFAMFDPLLVQLSQVPHIVDLCFYQLLGGTHLAKEKALTVLWRLACFQGGIANEIAETPQLIEVIWLIAMSDQHPRDTTVIASKLMVVLSQAPTALDKYEQFKTNPPTFPDPSFTPGLARRKLQQAVPQAELSLKLPAPPVEPEPQPIQEDPTPAIPTKGRRASRPTISKEQPTKEQPPKEQSADGGSSLRGRATTKSVPPAPLSNRTREAAAAKPQAAQRRTTPERKTTPEPQRAPQQAPPIENEADMRKQAVKNIRVARGAALPDHLKEKMKAATKKR